ncbi:chromobox protein 1 [Blastomyces parvus]|uniref:Chromobox protein 1 n=1 Tax=Blastomyces parvus TaxID=2060905 RepID=A0A2B7XHI4_9EURO|nr:chromobox protein 1 [Blastomyces parvus]
MPPALQSSDDESGGESIPFNEPEEDLPATKKATEDEDEDESSEEGEDVYVVEKIMGHEFAKDGTLLLQVKWKGYENPEDQTLEPEDNLVEGAEEVVREYFSLIGGRPEKPSKKRKSVTASTPTRGTAPSKRSKTSRASESNETPEMENNVADWVPKTKNWDSQVKSVDTIMRDPPTGGLFVYLTWNNDKKAKVSIQQAYEKCPQKMLVFYEQHLVFKDA